MLCDVLQSSIVLKYSQKFGVAIAISCFPAKKLGVKNPKGNREVFAPYLMNSVRIVKVSNNYVWMEVEENVVTKFQERFLLGEAYICDISSTYYNNNIFDELHREMLTFCVGNQPVLLIGDLNGRPRSLNDINEDPGPTLCSPIQQNKLLITVPIARLS